MEKLREAPDKIYLQEYVGSNGIHCLDYQNYDDDIEYTRSDIIPKHETVEQWEARTGETYPDDGPVWRTEILEDSKGKYTVHHLTTWKNYKPYGSPEIIEKWLKSNQPIVANHHGKPDSV